MGNHKGSSHRVYPSVRIEMLVRFKDEVPDPQKRVLAEQAQTRGFTNVTIRDCAKYFTFTVANTTLRRARAVANKTANKLLANLVTERFEFLKVEPVK